MRKRTLSLVAVVCALVLTGAAHAADPIGVSVLDVAERIGSITIDIKLTDDTGLESTLASSDVRADIDGRSLRVTGIEKTDYGRQPASIVMLVDVSGSMFGTPLAEAQAAIRQFFSLVEPGDRIALISFASGVNLLQDFTSDRSVLDAAVGTLQASGDTALYGGVNAAIELTKSAPEGGRVIVLLSDGVATEGLQNRATSLSVGEQSGTTIIAVGLGPSIDVDYLRDLTNRTQGSFVQAATPDQLQAAYADIAGRVTRRYFSDYRVEVEVPPTIDRTVDGTLNVQATVRGATVGARQHLGSLEGAAPPPYTVTITGLANGSTLAESVPVGFRAPTDKVVTGVEFLINGEVVGTSTGQGATHLLNPAAFETGVFTVAVRITDTTGGTGYGEISVVVPPPAAVPPAAGGGFSLPVVPLVLLALAAAIGYVLMRVIRGRLAQAPQYVTRSLKPEAGERMQVVQASREPDARPARARASSVQLRSRYRGRVVVMRESAILAGDLDSTREYLLGDAPLTIGTSSKADIRLDDETGLIADEEARIWIQRGRITFHRLTALSAMATSGVTPGWEFLENGDEMQIGPYRLVFQVELNEEPAQTGPQASTAAPQEHGMTLRTSEPLRWDNR